MERIALHVIEDNLARLRLSTSPEEFLMWFRWIEGNLDMAYELGVISEFQKESFTHTALEIIKGGISI